MLQLFFFLHFSILFQAELQGWKVERCHHGVEEIAAPSNSSTVILRNEERVGIFVPHRAEEKMATYEEKREQK